MPALGAIPTVANIGVNLEDLISNDSIEDMRARNIPERSNETPDLSDKGDEHTNAASFMREAVNGVCHHDSRHKLVSDRTDARANDGGHAPVARGRELRTHKEDNNTDDGQGKAEVAEPQSELGLCLTV